VIYQITGVVQERQAAKQQAIKQSSCFVLGTTIPENEVCDADIITAYKNQNNTVEKGFRFLKDPRGLDKALKELQETLLNQIRKETPKPTLRWIFQLLDGIELVKMHIDETTHIVVSGLTALKRRILDYFGSSVRKMYGLDLQLAPTL